MINVLFDPIIQVIEQFTFSLDLNHNKDLFKSKAFFVNSGMLELYY